MSVADAQALAEAEKMERNEDLGKQYPPIADSWCCSATHICVRKTRARVRVVGQKYGPWQDPNVWPWTSYNTTTVVWYRYVFDIYTTRAKWHLVQEFACERTRYFIHREKGASMDDDIDVAASIRMQGHPVTVTEYAYVGTVVFHEEKRQTESVARSKRQEWFGTATYDLYTDKVEIEVPPGRFVPPGGELRSPEDSPGPDQPFSAPPPPPEPPRPTGEVMPFK